MRARNTPPHQTRAATIVLVICAVLVGWAMVRGVPDGEVVAGLTSSPPVAPSSSGFQEAVIEPRSEVPRSGPGTFLFDHSGSRIVGSAGSLKRFRVAVEANLVDEMDEFIRTVDDTLGDERSWIAGKQVRFQRVPDGAAHDFTIYLVTRESAHRMCSTSGLDIRVDGVPYTSCQQTRKVIVNLDRWRYSVPEFNDAGLPLATYRHMVINHEVGHELGRRHEACPGRGMPAPAMQQQTLSLNGCLANPWPYLDGKKVTGPALP